MSERLEAGTKALWVRNHDLPFEAMQEGHKRPYRREAEAVLAAADEVTFSEEAVERAARALWIHNGLNGDDWIYSPPEDERKVFFTSNARAVIASLRGEANV
jgi:hypothetical protein